MNLFFDIFCLGRKFLVFNLVQRNLKIKYRNSWLGLVWTMLIPAASAVVYHLVFKYVMRVQMDHYLLFIVAGLIPWTAFASTVAASMESIVANQPLINKVPIPIQAFPLAEMLTGFLNILFAIPVIIGIAFWTGAPITWTWLFYVPLFALLFLVTYALGIFLSISFVYFRDLRHLLAIVLQLWFYVTPIIYAPDMIPDNLSYLLIVNPIGQIFVGIHSSLIVGAPPSFTVWTTTLLWLFSLWIMSIILFCKKRKTIAEIL